jgi:hypothetical protein
MTHETYTFDIKGRTYDDMMEEALDMFFEKYNISGQVFKEQWNTEDDAYTIIIKG